MERDEELEFLDTRMLLESLNNVYGPNSAIVMVQVLAMYADGSNRITTHDVIRETGLKAAVVEKALTDLEDDGVIQRTGESEVMGSIWVPDLRTLRASYCKEVL